MANFQSDHVLLQGLAEQLHGTIYRVNGQAFDPGVVLNRYLEDSFFKEELIDALGHIDGYDDHSGWEYENKADSIISSIQLRRERNAERNRTTNV